jgi:chromosome segregation ATPase
MQPSDALVQAVQSLTVEVKNLVNEVRANNARQQVQTDILRMSRLDLRLDRYEAELKTVRDRLALLEAESRNLQMLVTPEALEAQVSRMAYANKGDAIRQVKEAHEARLRMVNAEKELVQRREAELAGVVKGFREASDETEKRLQEMEESLKKLNEPQKDDSSDKPKSDPPGVPRPI